MNCGAYTVQTNKPNRRTLRAYDYYLDRPCFTWLELCQEMALFVGLHVYHDVRVYDQRLLKIYWAVYHRKDHHNDCMCWSPFWRRQCPVHTELGHRMRREHAFKAAVDAVTTTWVERGRSDTSYTIRKNFMNGAHKQLVRDRLNYLLTHSAQKGAA